MKSFRFSLLHPLWPAIILLAGLIVAMSMTSAQALPVEPESPSQPLAGIQGVLKPPTGTMQMPVADGWIDILDAEGQLFVGLPTAPDGSFAIAMPEGIYTLIAYPPPGSPYAPSLPLMVDVPPGPFIPVILHLTFPDISGYVRDCDAIPDVPIPGAYVVAHNTDWTVEQRAETDANGEFKIGGLAPNTTYVLEAFPPPESEYLPMPPITVTTPITDVVLELCIPPTNVIGVVHNPNGDPVPHAGIVVGRDDFWLETAANISGTFLFRGLPPGLFWLQAAPPWGKDGEGLLSSPPVAIVITQPDTLVDVGVITLPYAVKTVSGQVLNAATGAHLNEAIVTAQRLDKPGYADTPITPNGMFTLSLPGGEWHLVVEPPPPPPPPASPPPPPEWIFPGPPAWIAFTQPSSETEAITGVVLEVIPTNAWVEGQVLCPGEPPEICSPGMVPPEAIWVELRSDKIGSAVGLWPDYRFEIPIPDGWYELVVHVHDPDLPLQAPPPFPVFVGPGQRLILTEPMVLVPKDALIVGHVRSELGIGIPDVPVVGWQPEDFGWGWTKTDANGVYTMPVIPGEWFIEPQPLPEQPFVFREHPKLVRVAPHGTQVVNFRLTFAGARIKGIAIDANNPTPERLWGLDGWAAAWVPAKDEFFSDAPLGDGGFELKVRGGFTYGVGLNLPPRAKFVSGGTGVGHVGHGEVVTVAVPLERKDAGIGGQLVIAGTSNPAVGVWAEVFGEDEHGNWAGVRVEPENARYGMAVVSGTWHLRAWVDPASGYVAVPTTTMVTVQSNQVIPDHDFTVWPIRSTISGHVFDPHGQPLSRTFVFAEGESPFVGYFEASTKTDESGYFELPVLDGVYVVGAALPGQVLEKNLWLNPRPIENVATSVSTPATGLELHFRGLDGMITGTVSFGLGIGVTPIHPAYVWGWSETGEWAETEAELISGTAQEFVYAMPVISGTVWHVGAVYDDWDNGRFYESLEKVVNLTTTDRAQQDLVLRGPWPMPQPFIISFDGSQMQTIIMPDGVELSIPPGALVTSGTVTLFIFPTRELRPEEGREVIGVGYELWAIDQNGQEITHFNQNVVMTFPYPHDAVLAALGISEHLLLPVYYSTLVGRWILAASYVVDTVNNEISLQLDHFSKFGVFSTGPAQSYIYLPIVFKSSS